MTQAGIEKKEMIINSVQSFIIDNFLFGNKLGMVGLEDSFMENRILDSTGILELVEFIEDKYEIIIEDFELLPENLDSLNNISKYILLKKNIS